MPTEETISSTSRSSRGRTRRAPRPRSPPPTTSGPCCGCCTAANARRRSRRLRELSARLNLDRGLPFTGSLAQDIADLGGPEAALQELTWSLIGEMYEGPPERAEWFTPEHYRTQFLELVAEPRPRRSRSYPKAPRPQAEPGRPGQGRHGPPAHPRRPTARPRCPSRRRRGSLSPAASSLPPVKARWSARSAPRARDRDAWGIPHIYAGTRPTFHRAGLCPGAGPPVADWISSGGSARAGCPSYSGRSRWPTTCCCAA